MGTLPVGAQDSAPLLATLEDFKEQLGAVAASFSDSFLTSRLADATALVQAYIGRPILLASYQTTVRIMFGDRRLSLPLDVFPVIGIDSVMRDGVTIVPDPSGWDVNLWAGVVFPPGPCEAWWHAGRYVVNYRAGWAVEGMTDENGKALAVTLPGDVRSAALTAARALVFAGGRDPFLRSESEQGVGSTSWATPDPATGGLPPDASAILDRYQSAGIS